MNFFQTKNLHLVEPFGTLSEVDPRKALHAHAPAPGHPDQPAVHLHGDQYANHRLCTQPAPGPNGRGDRGPPEAEPADRTPTTALSADSPGQS